MLSQISPLGGIEGILVTFGNVVETIFFGNLKDDGEGCGVYTILNSVVDILSIGIGILAVIGITIVGIKYLTAKGDIEQTRKAKTRMFQIVLGLVAYVLLYAGIQFLLPGGHLNNDQSCATVSDQELAELKATEETTSKSQTTPSSKTKKESTSETCSITKNISPQSAKGDGYKNTIKLCDKTFKLYRQSYGSYKNQTYAKKFYNKCTTIHCGGCGPTSLAIVLSGYKKKKDPGAVAKGLDEIANSINKNPKASSKPMEKYVKSLGLKVKSHKNSASNTYSNMRKALLAGHQIVLYVGKGGSGWSKFTSTGQHFISILGINTKNNKVFVGNPNSHPTKWYSLSDVAEARYSDGFWIEVYK